jgi:GNAT superfamily N-acetyltransferase
MIIALQKWILNKEVIKELGEPLIYIDGDKWVIEENAFGCINGDKIRYLFVDKNSRGKGLGSKILNQLESYSCHYQILAPKNVIQFYLKHNYKSEKFTTNWVKLYK